MVNGSKKQKRSGLFVSALHLSKKLTCPFSCKEAKRVRRLDQRREKNSLACFIFLLSHHFFYKLFGL